MRQIGVIRVYIDGSIAVRQYREDAMEALTLDQFEMVYRAALGAQSALEKPLNGSLVQLAASLLAKAGAEKARQKRKEVIDAIHN